MLLRAGLVARKLRELDASLLANRTGLETKERMMRYLEIVIVVLIVIVLLLFAILLMLSPITDANKVDVIIFFGICIGILVAFFVVAHVGAWVGRFLVWLFLENAESRNTSAHTRSRKVSTQTRPTTEFVERAVAEQVALNGDNKIEMPAFEESEQKNNESVRGGRELIEFVLILIVGILLAIFAGVGCSSMRS